MPHHQGLRIKFISEIPNQPSHQNDPLDLIQNDPFFVTQKLKKNWLLKIGPFCTSRKKLGQMNLNL